MHWDNKDLFCNELSLKPKPELGRILVTGANGYIGGRLVPELLARGYRVRVMVRAYSPEQVEKWKGAEVIVADALNAVSLEKALKGIYCAYYLIHSLSLGSKHFETIDAQAAVNFRRAADNQKVKRVIYLGGLGDTSARLSAHLRSRMRVAQELRRGSYETTILRAAVIIGSGSASYEIIEHLVKNLPVILIPNWANTRCQPIGIRDIIKYLVGSLETQATAGNAYDIGGPDVLTYHEMIRILAELHGKKRLILRSPVSNIALYSYITSLFTPVPAAITKSLMAGIRNEVVCQNNLIKAVVPVDPISYKESLVRAMSREEQDKVYTRWSDAYPPAHELAMRLHELQEPPQFSSSASIYTNKDRVALFQSVCKIGGKEGWFHGNWLRRMRGALDRLLAGVGTSRGRKSPHSLNINDVIDFWRVEDLQENQKLLLRSEMKLPGKAWLEFYITKSGPKNKLSVTAYYKTFTIFGIIYWYLFLPFHYYIFNTLIRQIEKRS